MVSKKKIGVSRGNNVSNRNIIIGVVVVVLLLGLVFGNGITGNVVSGEYNEGYTDGYDAGYKAGETGADFDNSVSNEDSDDGFFSEFFSFLGFGSDDEGDDNLGDTLNLGSSCFNEDDCSPGETCSTAGVCIVDNTGGCTVDLDCYPGEVCNAGVCIPGGTLGECQTDVECIDSVCDINSIPTACVPCDNDIYCSGNPIGEVCNLAQTFCVQCNDEGDCNDPELPACNVNEGNRCAGCVDNADCNGNPNGNICDQIFQTCGECNNNNDCAGSLVCATPVGARIDQSNFCVECTVDAHCALSPGGNVCSLFDYSCVQCKINADCPNNGECIQQVCGPGEEILV